MYSDAELHPAAEGDLYQLRPLSAGEVFDRTFALYRRHFLMFIGISLLPALLAAAGGIVRVLVMHFTHRSQFTSDWSSPSLAILTIITTIVQLAAYGLSQAATTFALSRVYLGDSVTVGSAYRKAVQHWVRNPLLPVVQVLWAGWLPIIFVAVMFGTMAVAARSVGAGTIIMGLAALLVFATFPYGVYRFVKLSLAMPVAVMEDKGIVASMKRSKALLPDRKWRIFLLLLLLIVLYLILGSALAYVGFMALRGGIRLVVAQVIGLSSNFFATLILQPISAIGFCLFYFDERVRQEGFDIEFMMQKAGLGGESAQANAAPEAGIA